MSAELALTMGLVHAVYPAESFRDRVTAFERKLAALPTEAAGVAKTAVDIAAGVDRGTARDFDRYADTHLLTSDEHRAMLEAFKNRSRPAGRPYGLDPDRCLFEIFSLDQVPVADYDTPRDFKPEFVGMHSPNSDGHRLSEDQEMTIYNHHRVAGHMDRGASRP